MARALIKKPYCTKVKTFTWIDTGTNKSYSNARKFFKDNFITKPNDFYTKKKIKSLNVF